MEHWTYYRRQDTHHTDFCGVAIRTIIFFVLSNNKQA